MRLLLLVFACGSPQDTASPPGGAETGADEAGETSETGETGEVSPGETGDSSGSGETGAGETGETGAPEAPENVIWIVIDDVGVDSLTAYGEAGPVAPTPTLDGLVADGVVFEQAWVNPSCSPTRASILTGRHAARHGVGRWLDITSESFEMALDEVTIPEVLSEAGWSTGSFGKWHLGSCLSEDPPAHPTASGFDLHEGSFASTGMVCTESELGEADYFLWEEVAEESFRWVEGYPTTDTVDDALAWIATAEEPWFAHVSFNAAHWPWHVPPESLISTSVVDERSSELALYHADVEAMDTEIGRLLEGLGDARDRTTIAVISDNGTDDDVIPPPWDASRAKGTVHDGGIRAPLIVAGPRVTSPGARAGGLVQGLDLFATTAEIAGISLEGLAREDGSPVSLDSVSLLPLLDDPDAEIREYIYSERFVPNGPPPWSQHHRTIRDASWKYAILDFGGAVEEQLYRYEEGALDEGVDLLSAGPLDADAADALARLQAELAKVEAGLVYGP